VDQKDNATDERCPYCGHVRCEKCEPDRWPELADGCCNCQAEALKRFGRRVD
jgi:hypothetical protein